MKNKAEPKTKFDIGRVLVYGPAVFQAYHMGRAFHVYDPSGWHLSGVNLGGLILGAIINIIIAQAALNLPTITANFSSLKELLPKLSKKADKKEEQTRARALKKLALASKQSLFSQVGFYILLAFSAMMVAPALFILWTVTLPFNPYFIGVMAFIGAIAPDVAITVGGFIASDAGSDAQRPIQRRSATNPATLSDAGSDAQRPIQRRPEKKLATVSDAEAKIYRCECGKEFVNRNKYSGHTGKCAKYQEKKRAQLDPSLLIDPSKAVK